MTALADINRKAHAVLRRELGAADFARFLLQFDTGAGDYTAERQAEDRPSAEDPRREHGRARSTGGRVAARPARARGELRP